MATQRDESRGRLIRVQGPALPVVTLVSGSTPPAPVGERIRVSGPALPVVTLMSDPLAQAATVHLRRPLVAGDDAEAIRRRMYALAGHVNAWEAEEKRAGLTLDEARSGIRAGAVVLVLVPNDPTDALATCKRVANILFNASPGVTVKVFAADQPNAPVYELAA